MSCPVWSPRIPSSRPDTHTHTCSHACNSSGYQSVCLSVLGIWAILLLMLWLLSLRLAALTAGSESGRSSPYYSQPEPRCATPTTTYQAPKHFHVPGRPSSVMLTTNLFTNLNLPTSDRNPQSKYLPRLNLVICHFQLC